MSTQLALPFEDVPVTCPIQRRYQVIAPLLAGQSSIAERAQEFSVGYSTVSLWLREFREQGMPALFSANEYLHGPYTPERVIVVLLYFKCCAPKPPPANWRVSLSQKQTTPSITRPYRH